MPANRTGTNSSSTLEGRHASRPKARYANGEMTSNTQDARTRSPTAHELHLYPRRERRLRGDEQVRQQSRGGIDAVGREVAHPGGVEHRVFDEEVAAALARRLVEDDIRGIRHNVGLAR